MIFPGQQEFEIQKNADNPDLVRVTYQSRHSNTKHYNSFIEFESTHQNVITGYYCTCPCGERTVGCCSHVAASLTHLFLNQTQVKDVHRKATQFIKYIEDSEQIEDPSFSEDDDDDYSATYSLS